jgi:G6PDH family F420-dependent oxidoreductase
MTASGSTTTYGFHASHEQLPPDELLVALRHAAEVGFTAGMCSDHFAPWSERQGHSGYAWAWLGAALATTALPMGVVTAPGQRYHPAITAQAAATLEQMHPGRFWLALGSGQALNEHITGERWPAKEERLLRLEECVAVLRALFDGETVTHDGRVRVDRARLWSRPATPPPLLAAAVTPPTAARAADLGGRPDHDQPARRGAEGDAGRLPRRRRSGTGGAPGARVLGPGPGHRPADRPRPVAGAGPGR